MSKRKPELYIKDIADSIAKIEKYTEGRPVRIKKQIGQLSAAG